MWPESSYNHFRPANIEDALKLRVKTASKQVLCLKFNRYINRYSHYTSFTFILDKPSNRTYNEINETKHLNLRKTT